MADIELGDLGNGGDGDDVVEGESVAGVGLDSVFGGERCSVGDPAQFGGSRLAFRMSVAAGVKLDDRSTELHGCVDLALRWFDEQADANPGSDKAVDEWRQGRGL